MKSKIEDRIKLLAKAQESMSDVADMMTCWDKSQQTMEKSAFESLNMSDEVLNLSKEGSILIEGIMESSRAIMDKTESKGYRKMEAVLEEILDKFLHISYAAGNVNEVSHSIEFEAASQKKLKEDFRKSLIQVSESLDSAIACAEMVLAEE